MKSKLGIAFPPCSDVNQTNFSINHLNILGLNNTRINVEWNLRQPTKNTYDWSALSNRLSLFKSANKKVLITIDMKSLPQWWISLSVSDKIIEFKKFCNKLLTLYSGQIAYIQFGNEWNWEVESFLPEPKDQLFIDMTNVLYQEVKSFEGLKPLVSLGSIAIGGLRIISYVAGSISNVQFEKGLLFSAQDIINLNNNKDIYIQKIKNIIKNVNFDIIDLHLYDDYFNWKVYLQDYKNLINQCNKNSENIIVSEFGGPHPTLEFVDEKNAKYKLNLYLSVLNEINPDLYLYFKMIQSVASPLVEHPDSFLIDSFLKTNERYDVIKNYNC